MLEKEYIKINIIKFTQMKNYQINYKINKVTHKIVYSNKTSNLVKKDILKIKNNPKILFIYDQKIKESIIKNYIKTLKSLKNKFFTLPVAGGKQNKDLNLLLNIINILNKNNFTKNSIVLSIGGGVVGDVSSFAAALYMRGTFYFHVPSTMTSILDSCIGGKTAINYDNKINLLGTYYHPFRVYISHEILKYIPEREYRSGFAEAIKCGIIDNKQILRILNNDFLKIQNREFKVLKEISLKVLKSKIKFFINDVREKRKRLCLNFGHTFAHAVEMAGSLKNKYQINHGEAVALGIICEMKYANTNAKFINYILNIINKYGLSKSILLKRTSKNNFYKKIFENLFLDKKRFQNIRDILKLTKILIQQLVNLEILKK